ncbi:uncharacterized protein LOC110631122 [Manihot esculenta]|uniref:Uncharacterized protein n=1 Tax=Manihot esculenta TaxID=3983 RepID=A0A2C9UKH0_MANES|nr:uncharacterized protein LOC110631122 [Manihot esculenta]OAY31278.1 hypothetical protein MANES_14G099200v8 [Manihot esculenta]
MSLDHCLEFEANDDQDDYFYAELRQQVLLLISDDNDDLAETRSSNFPADCKPGSNRLTGSFPVKLRPESYFDWWGTRDADSVPTWLVNLWRNGNGTGVFIPQSRRRCVRGRMNKGRRRAYK